MMGAMKKFVCQVGLCLRSIGIPLFLLTVVAGSIDQLITDQMQAQLMSPHGASPTVWLWGIGSLLLNLLAPILGMLITLAAISKQKSWLGFLKQNLNQNLIEELRSWGKSLIWCFALVMPGLIRFFQYLFVPFVVCFDPEYQAGRKDALETSRDLARGRLLSLVSLFFLFSVMIPLLLTNFDSVQVIWKTPLPASLLCFVEMLSNICFIVALSQIYQTQSERRYESDVSVERS
jgi:hypothetical protein